MPIKSKKKNKISMIKGESSNIDSIGHDDKKNILHVIFLNSSEYIYYDVDEDIFDEFLNSESKGKYFYKYIRDAYDYEKLN